MFYRVLWLVPTLLAVYTASFALLRAAPGDPLAQERELTPETRAELERQHYLDRPWHEAYALSLKDLVTLKGQKSMSYPDLNVVRDIIAKAFPVSLGLGLTALTLSVVLGSAVGIFSAVRRYSLLDHVFTGAALLGISLPSFVIGMLLMIVLAFWLRMLPAGGWGSPSQLVLPAIALATFPTAYIARLTRNSFLDVLPSDFMRTARSKGLPGSQVLLAHGLRNAFLPVLSYLGPAAAAVFTGSFVVEHIFSVPGLGQYFVQSALNRDHPLILACVMLYATLLLVMNLLVDVGYAALDPRIRYD